MESGIYTGWVRHRRLKPVEHSFRNRIYLMYLDLDELDSVFEGRWCWSTHRPALARFRRADHLGDPTQPLGESIRDFVVEQGYPRSRGADSAAHASAVFRICDEPGLFLLLF